MLPVADRVRRYFFRNPLAWWVRNRLTSTHIVRMPWPLDGCSMQLPNGPARAYPAAPHEPAVVRYIVENVRSGSVVVDVGAYAGYYSLLLSRLVGEHGHVHAFEPVPENFQLLVSNIRLNERSNILANMAAVGLNDGRVVFRRSRESFSVVGGLLNEEDTSRYEDIEVEMRSLDAYFSTLGWPDTSFVKIDVEGAEADVVSGMRELIERFSPVLLIEVHDQRDRGGATEARTVLPLLFRCGYRIFVLERDPQLRYPLREPEHWKGHGHCVAVRDV